ncbi:MAG TPA: hypothetical protein VHZ76_06905 [Gammaproteobacteria bacterium]|jgi:hypothetical protein|nr:hypothetical protein [Gammaproteobacteria bacterium]
MVKKYGYILAVAMLVAQPVLADDHNKACESIAKACKNAGYTRNGAAGKEFWHDCMKPVMLGKSVANVSVDADTAKACRSAKMKELNENMNDLQKAQ